ncbi:MAG: glycosyltransferase [Ruminococcus sp.]|nr:glycosyltransferase [Ruminococcus sp.]
MSVYAGERAEYLRESLESMAAQTYPADEIVLVCDGELNQELDGIIAEFEDRLPALRVLRMPKRSGTGACANAGLKECRNEYIVKMDSDDISLPERCEYSLYTLAKRPGIDILGAYIEEFDSRTGETIAVRKTPHGHDRIIKYARRRNPFNNQTLVYKRSAALSCGGYSNDPRCEDYDFVVRMLASGAVGRNIGRVLVRYRVTEGNYKRRKNWANTRSFIAVRYRIHKSGFSSLADFLIPTAMQLFIFIMPSFLTGWIYRKMLRK